MPANRKSLAERLIKNARSAPAAIGETTTEPGGLWSRLAPKLGKGLGWAGGIAGGLWGLNEGYDLLMKLLGKDPETLSLRMQEKARREDLLSNALLIADEESQRRTQRADSLSFANQMAIGDTARTNLTALGTMTGGLNTDDARRTADAAFLQIMNTPRSQLG